MAQETTTYGRAGQPISNSQFYMWRCVIALAHADGMVQQAERDYINRVIAGMDRKNGLTDEQKATFQRDLEVPQSISDLLTHINEPQWRGQLIYFGGLLARADGTLDPREDEILKKLRADQLNSLDLDRIRADTKVAVQDEMFRHDLKMSELRPQGGLMAILDSLLLRLGIDILEN
ncbi:MAG: TerB family tellurite resistance protein [Micavibrio sp.]|nr:TerB family tellurite resistance protein [Micavibrio sp.]